MRSRTLARWLVVGSLAGLGLFVWAEASPAEAQTTAQNTADSPESSSGDAGASNETSGAQVGPTQNGDGGGSVSQEGDNEADISQEGEARSGDSVAGSQVVGVVSAGDTTVVASNSSEDAEARSGDATVRNTLGTVQVGPRLEGGDTDVSVSQIGDNEADSSQSGTAITGDAVAGAQVAGIVTSGGASAAAVLENTSEDAESESGDATASNDLGELSVGPVIEVEEEVNNSLPGVQTDGDASDDTSSPVVPTGAALAVVPAPPGVAQVPEDATLFQEGDNEGDVDQTSSSLSGDAVAGGQVVGLVASEAGSISVVSRNSSEDDTAETGEAVATNTIGEAAVGPELDVEAFDGLDVALTQEGDNELSFDQSANATTGDAVAGGQVVGAVGSGDTVIVLDNTSEDSEATSGNALATNTAATADVDCIFCDVEAGEISVGPVLYTGKGGGTATVSQVGDNELDASQSGDAVSGDAVAGGQVAGVVTTAGGDVTIVASNSSEDAESTSGNSVVENTAAVATVECAFCTVEAGTISAGPSLYLYGRGEAAVDQTGDNSLELDQSGTATSGDAVAGGQVTGVVASGAVTMVLANSSEDDEATSGDAAVRNTAAAADVTIFEVDPRVGQSTAGSLHAGPDLYVGFAAEQSGSITQTGDNELELGQSGSALSGDAVAGGQVAGVVADGGSVAIVASNDSEDSESVSGDASVENQAATATVEIETNFDESNGVVGRDAGTAEDHLLGRSVANFTAGSVSSGPQAYVGGRATEEATVTQTGDNELELDQSGDAVSGDAVAGGQVMGSVTSGGSVAIVASNTSEDSTSESGDASVENVAATATVDIETIVVMDDLLSTADAHLGQASRNITAGTLHSGPQAYVGQPIPICPPLCPFEPSDLRAEVTQTGDNELELGQSGTAASGDAVAGGQVFGVVSSDGAVVAIDATNSSDGDTAESGDASVANHAATATVDIETVIRLFDSVGATAELIFPIAPSASNITAGAVQSGPQAYVGGNGAVEEAVVTQTGDNELELDQSGGAVSGDAVAGGQVTGVVAAGGSVAIVASNTSEDATSESGDASVENRAATATVEIETAVFDGGAFPLGAHRAAPGQNISAGTLHSGPQAYVGAIIIDPPFPPILIPPVSLSATVTQTGDNSLELGQSGDAASGDAVAGGQVFGVVSTGGVVAIDATNTSEDADSESGAATVRNRAADATVQIEPLEVNGAPPPPDLGAFEAGTLRVGPNAYVGGGFPLVQEEGTVVQTGDNELELDQLGSAGTGDAVAGGQVVGVVSSGSVAIVADNTSEDDSAETGAATVENSAATAAVDCFFFCPNIAAGVVAVGPQLYVGNGPGPEPIEVSGTVEQTGDNELEIGQSGSATTGDAVAGGQVFGVVATDGADVAIDATNTSEDATAETGSASSVNTVAEAAGTFVPFRPFESEFAQGFVFVGPGLNVRGAEGAFTVSQTGSNEFEVSQGGNAGTGDAVAGGQVTGVVAAGSVDAVLENNSDGDTSESGSASETDFVGQLQIGPFLEHVVPILLLP